MTEGSRDETFSLPAWLVNLCKWGWRKRTFLFGTVIVSGVLNILDSLVLVDPATLHAPLLGWSIEHWYIILGLFLFLGLLTLLCGLIQRLDAPLSTAKLRHRYLEQLVSERAQATLQGIPAGLIAQSVHLADIFIAPQFRPNRPIVDFPLSAQELTEYSQSLKQSNAHALELERVLFESEKSWQHQLHATDRVGLAEVWKRLDSERAVVIQGFPGMGKSTLMERLTLHLAWRGLRKPDPTMPEQECLTPGLLPILLRLGEFATACSATPTLALATYLQQKLETSDLPGLSTVFQQALQNGSCLVMFDGLDEVSEAKLREQVQEQIRTFITAHFSNRFLITSRVAGYDQHAFPAYPHFTLAELDEKQIAAFLPRWCLANMARDRGTSSAVAAQDTSLNREVAQRVATLTTAIEANGGVRKLAETPLLLTLLLVMQQNSIVLPRQRVELYDVVTRTLLENRNLAKHLQPVPEIQAIQYLGPLAFQMQETNNSFMRQRDVEAQLAKVIRQPGDTDAKVEAEAQRFLQHMRERGGLFASRVGDYFGFIHRTFQEYFAARYILNNIKLEQQEWIARLVDLACREDALWREPFLLAVAYQSRENEQVANAILQALLARNAAGDLAQEVAHLLLAADALLEAKELTIDPAWQTTEAERLLTAYTHAQHTRAVPLCQSIENTVLRWLRSLPKEAYRLPSILRVLKQSISDDQHLARQRTSLTLLANIAARLQGCAPIVFTTIIPPLLALTGQPAIGPYQPAEHLAPARDFDVADMALATLSFLGQSGPPGLYLPRIREHFATHPEQLALLAHYSLESRTLLTPTLVPAANENYKRYEAAIGRWITLRQNLQAEITDQQIANCLAIHQELLACAETVSYPTSLHLLAMLERSDQQADLAWQTIWQSYLLECLETGDYLSYQQAALLWHTLFPADQLQPLISVILKHYISLNTRKTFYAQHFIAFSLRYLNNLRYLRYLNNLNNLNNLSDLRYLNNLNNLRYLSDLRYLNNLRYLSDLRYLNNLRYLSDLSNLSNLSDLSDLLLKRDTIVTARQTLANAADRQKFDLLAILQARLLQFQINKQTGPEIEEEIQQIADAALTELLTTQNDVERREATLDVLRSLPARTQGEIQYILRIAEAPQQYTWLVEPLQAACARALKQAEPIDEQAWLVIEQLQTSSVQQIAQAAQSLVYNKKRRDRRQGLI